MSEKTLDVICLGRAAVDLYAEQVGARLEDAQSFAKYLGGSAANVAAGTARQGLRSAMLTRVGDEHMGRFVREALAAEGVDVSHVRTDRDRLTGLALLGIKDRNTFPLIFYRENCADMALDESDVDEAFIASAKALLVTGTHLSTESGVRACRRAIGFARGNDTRVVLDIDYRPVLWGLAGRGLGERRFVASESVTARLQRVVPHCDLIAGTEEEIHIAGGCTDTIEALRRLRAHSGAAIVVKRGPLGASVFTGPIPPELNQGITVAGVQVEVLNVLGAGDAFMSGLLRGWLEGETWQRTLAIANACGALVVSRHGCTPAMPSRVELDDYLPRAATVRRPDLDPRLLHLHRVTNRKRPRSEILGIAFDHRTQFEEMCELAGVDDGHIPYLKKLILEAAYRGADRAGLQGNAGVLIDGRYGQAALERVTGTGWWIGRPVELPGSRPLEFESGNNVAAEIRSWPEEQVVKCLLHYHLEDSEDLRKTQERKVMDLFDACMTTQHELLLAVMPPPGSPVHEGTLAQAISRFYDLGVYPDWWLLPAQEPAAWQHIGAVLDARDPYCRGIVLLAEDVPEDELADGVRVATGQPWIKGVTLGRSLWAAACRRWLTGELDDHGCIEAIAENYFRLIELWRSR